jgi:hypothetical protein
LQQSLAGSSASTAVQQKQYSRSVAAEPFRERERDRDRERERERERADAEAMWRVKWQRQRYSLYVKWYSL